VLTGYFFHGEIGIGNFVPVHFGPLCRLTTLRLAVVPAITLGN
jgi:hypothetical protein